MSTLFLELRYARQIGQYIKLWKVKKDHPFHGTGRCPVCNDSQKSLSKCRFHIREHEGTVFVSCFNCGYSSNLAGFLKVHHPAIYNEFIFERYKETGSTKEHVITTEKPQIDETLLKPSYSAQEREKNRGLDLPLVSELGDSHPLVQYIKKRKLPDYPFMYARKFYEFASQYNPDIQSNGKDEPRLIIPFYDRAGNVFAFQGRDLTGKSLQKYVTITVNPKVPKIFGIDRVNFSEPITIVEGPLDSLFLQNSVASVNASLIVTAKKLEPYINKSLLTLVYDCEPRNETIVDMYADAIKQGYKVVIWPDATDRKMDINDLVMEGKNPSEIIKANTYQGLMAQIQFQKWKKV